MNRTDIIAWLREERPEHLQTLWAQADTVRREHVGDAVHLRGLVEISNFCRRQCAYCGLRCGNNTIQRYRLSYEEMIAAAAAAAQYGYGTVVLQSGEDLALTCQAITEIIIAIKQKFDLAVTLSLGERRVDELLAWRQAGADRYLLRFETGNTELFDAIHPPVPDQPPHYRYQLLTELFRLGYEVGSGIMIGIPGQSLASLADDILTFSQMQLDMIGVGPYIPHPHTPLAAQAAGATPDQAPRTVQMALKVIALTRLLCPDVNIPATTALAVLDPLTGYETALQCGANVIMPNLTPAVYRSEYDIYPGKTSSFDMADSFDTCLKERIKAIGRTPGAGRGDSLHYLTSHRSFAHHV